MLDIGYSILDKKDHGRLIGLSIIQYPESSDAAGLRPV
jgi:hypothetical protein